MDVLTAESFNPPKLFSAANFRPVDIPDETFVKTSEVAKKGKFTIVGENHSESEFATDIIIPLLETEEYDRIFIEALLRGHIEDTKESKEEPGKVHDFDYNVEKYRRIIESAEENNTEVYGLDAHGSRKSSSYLMVKEWANYIEENAGEKNLALIGSIHVFNGFHYIGSEYPEMSRMSIQSFLPEESYSVALARPGKELDRELTEGFYRIENLPKVLPEKFQKDKAADFIRVSTNSIDYWD